MSTLIVFLAIGGAFDDGHAELTLLPGYHDPVTVTVGAEQSPVVHDEATRLWIEKHIPAAKEQPGKPARKSDYWAPPAGMTDAEWVLLNVQGW